MASSSYLAGLVNALVYKNKNAAVKNIKLRLRQEI